MPRPTHCLCIHRGVHCTCCRGAIRDACSRRGEAREGSVFFYIFLHFVWTSVYLYVTVRWSYSGKWQGAIMTPWCSSIINVQTSCATAKSIPWHPQHSPLIAIYFLFTRIDFSWSGDFGGSKLSVNVNIQKTWSVILLELIIHEC